MNKSLYKFLALVLFAGVIGLAVVYYFGSDRGQERAVTNNTNPTKYMNFKHGYSIENPDLLKHSTNIYEGAGGMVTEDKWFPSTEVYAIYILSYVDGVNPRLEFNAVTKRDENIQVAGQNVKKVVGIEVVSEKGTLIHIGPVKNKGQNYMLVYSSGSQLADPQSLIIFDQIVSSFHFSDKI